MIKLNTRFTVIFLSLLGMLAISLNNANAFDGVSGGVFKFQHKLAQSGKMQSQYKLGRMYETGRGTEKNLDEAMRWYTEASKQGFAPADDRITYYEVKQTGYDSARYGDWVDAVIKKASQRVPESMELLAQMYTEGVGVRKNDKSALSLLQRLSMEGNSEVDADIAMIESRIALQEKKRQAWIRKSQARKKAAERAGAATVVLKPASAGSASADVANVAAAGVPKSGTTSIADKVEAELVAKKKRYEAVMKKLQEEQALLEQQQAWAEN